VTRERLNATLHSGRPVSLPAGREEGPMQLERIAWSGHGTPVGREINQRLVDEGFEVSRWRDEADARYEAHAHDHDESLWVIEGEIVFGIGGREYPLGPGDRLMLPAGTVHTARVGRQGADYLIGVRP
jgi:quercetin dioxygenase-like cupin family protein